MHHCVLVTQIRTFDSKRKAPLDDQVLSVLRQIGAALDERRTVLVRNGGLVTLDSEPAITEEVDLDYGQQSRRPTAGSRQGPSRRKGSPRGSRPPGTRSRVGGLVADYEAQLADVEEAYPGSKLLPDKNGLWLFAPSLILKGLGRRAIFLIAFPNTPKVEPRGWAFWEEDGGLRWIGPKHTNFFDGSVCAYSNAKDGIWYPGDDVRNLLDIYSVWVVRHLHLEMLGRWAGRQYTLPSPRGVLDPYYRLTQFQPDELCSCPSGQAYGQCCRPGDLRTDLIAAKRLFERMNSGKSIGDRRPPPEVVAYLEGGGPLPKLIDHHEFFHDHRSKREAR